MNDSGVFSGSRAKLRTMFLYCGCKVASSGLPQAQGLPHLKVRPESRTYALVKGQLLCSLYGPGLGRNAVKHTTIITRDYIFFDSINFYLFFWFWLGPLKDPAKVLWIFYHKLCLQFFFFFWIFVSIHIGPSNNCTHYQLLHIYSH